MVKNSKSLKYLLIFLVNTTLCFSAYTFSREERILENIKPIGSVYLTAGAQLAVGEAPKLGKDSGMKRYKSNCYVCHDTGASGAPKIGNASEWSARIKVGKDVLYDHAIKGFKAMPAKGACLSCSDEEIKLAVDYMIEKSR